MKLFSMVYQKVSRFSVTFEVNLRAELKFDHQKKSNPNVLDILFE